MLENILAIILAYLIAAFPSAYIIAKIQAKNIFELGSGNMGAMNVIRNLNVKSGIAVLVLDIAKGYLAVLAASLLAADNIVYVAAITATIAHAWSIYVNFRGGKAIATSFGALLAIHPISAFAVLFAIIVMSLILRKRTNLAAVIAMPAHPILVLCLFFITKQASFKYLSIASVIMILIVFYKHIPALKEEFA